LLPGASGAGAPQGSATRPPYRVGPDDVLTVFVWKEGTLTTTVRVRPDGKVSLPLMGEVQAAGQTPVELEREITRALREFVRQPHVNVIVNEVNSPKISVLGKVRRPNSYTIFNRVTVLEAIAMAGGLDDFARADRVIVVRNSVTPPVRILVNVRKLLFEEGSGPVYLQAGDSVYVEQ
jgi:polysaccharide export outer membrane protein